MHATDTRTERRDVAAELTAMLEAWTPGPRDRWPNAEVIVGIHDVTVSQDTDGTWNAYCGCGWEASPHSITLNDEHGINIWDRWCEEDPKGFGRASRRCAVEWAASHVSEAVRILELEGRIEAITERLETLFPTAATA